jgi:hypothetical protein
MRWKKRLLEIQRLQAKHGLDRSLARQFPDLRVDKKVPPTSDRFYPPATLSMEQVKLILGPKFLVSHIHKSGYQVLLRSELPWAGGKKP